MAAAALGVVVTVRAAQLRIRWRVGIGEHLHEKHAQFKSHNQNDGLVTQCINQASVCRTPHTKQPPASGSTDRVRSVVGRDVPPKIEHWVAYFRRCGCNRFQWAVIAVSSFVGS